MRLKEDNSSWRAGGIIKRDAQHGGPVQERSVQPKHKDKVRWCKGRVGIEHQWLRQIPETGMFSRRHPGQTKITMEVCQKCGKQNYKTVLWDGKTWEEHWDKRNT